VKLFSISPGPLFQVPKEIAGDKSFRDDNSWLFKRSFLDKNVSLYFSEFFHINFKRLQFVLFSFFLKTFF